MTDPVAGDPMRMLEPVHAGESEAPKEKWAARLVMYLRVMAVVALVKGLFHWAVVCGITDTWPGGFEVASTPYQAATVFFAVIDLVAAVGLWPPPPPGAPGGGGPPPSVGGGRGPVLPNSYGGGGGG